MKLAAVLLFAGCAASEKGLDFVRYCTTAADCDENEICAAGVCSLEGGSPEDLEVEFVPPEGASLWLAAGVLADVHEASVTLSPPVTVDVSVIGESGEEIPAVVAFSMPSPIERAPFVVSAVAGDSVDLPSGCYLAQVAPSDPNVPPFLSPSDGSTTCFDDEHPPVFEASAPSAGHVLGRIAWADGTGIEGAQVQALAADAERTASQPVQTGPCVESGGTGCFDLAVARSETAIRIQVQSPPGRDAAPLPTVTFERTLAPFAEPPGPADPQPLGDLLLDPFGPPIEFESTVEGCLTSDGCATGSAETVPIPGAHVTFRSTALGPEAAPLSGELEVSTDTDLAGAFRVQVLAGAYEVRVVSSDGIRVGEGDLRTFSPVVRSELVTDADGDLHAGGRLFSLEPQVLLAGVLDGADDESAAGISIDVLGGPQLYSMGSVPAEESVNRSAFGATADDGSFAIDLDAGHYDVYFRSPHGSAAAWSLWPNRDLSESEPDAQVSLQGGSVLVGNVGQPSGVGAAGVIVRAYTQVGEGWLQIGEAVTDDNGDYITFLPVDL